MEAQKSIRWNGAWNGFILHLREHVARKGASQVVLVGKNLPANAGSARDVGLIPGLGRSPGGGNGDPLQYFCLGISMDRGVWWTTLHGVARVKQYLVTKPPPPRDNLLNE